MNNELGYLSLVAVISGLSGLGLFTLMVKLSPIAGAFMSSAVSGVIAMILMTMPQIDWRSR